MDEPFSTPSPQENSGSMRGPIIGFSIGFVIILCIVAFLIWNSKSAETRNPVRPAVMEAASVVDPYAAFLRVTNVHMLQATNMLGGKMYYVEGNVTNLGKQAVVGATVEITFRDVNNQICQREQRTLTVVLRRQPALDIGALGMDPLKPTDMKDFQITFEKIVPEWGGQYPEVRVVTAVTK